MIQINNPQLEQKLEHFKQLGPVKMSKVGLTEALIGRAVTMTKGELTAWLFPVSQDPQPTT